MVEITLPIMLQLLQTAGILVGIIYYITIMRNAQRNQRLQLETRQTQLFMDIYQNTVTHEFQKAFRKIMITQWNSYDEFYRQNDYFDPNHPDPEFIESVNLIASYYEGMGVLIKENLFDIRMVALLMTGMTRSFWKKYAPYIDKWREDLGFPRLWSETEYLYDELMKYIDEHPELET